MKVLTEGHILSEYVQENHQDRELLQGLSFVKLGALLLLRGLWTKFLLRKKMDHLEMYTIEPRNMCIPIGNSR